MDFYDERNIELQSNNDDRSITINVIGRDYLVIDIKLDNVNFSTITLQFLGWRDPSSLEVFGPKDKPEFDYNVGIGDQEVSYFLDSVNGYINNDISSITNDIRYIIKIIDQDSIRLVKGKEEELSFMENKLR